MDILSYLLGKNASSGGGKYAPRYISFRGYNGDNLDYEVSNIDTSNTVSMSNMFYGCSNLLNLNLSNFVNVKCTQTNTMFYNCGKLKSIDLRNFTSINGMEVDSMFANCNALMHLDIRSFDFTNNLTYSFSMFNNIPNACEIIVKDDTQKEWINTNFSRFTNVKTMSEYEGG